MNAADSINVMPYEDAKKVFRAAYQHLQSKQYEECINELKPTLNNVHKIDCDTLNILSLMWATTGDSYLALKSIDEAIAAYRKSIELDDNSACIGIYARAVAKYNIKTELPYAYEKLLSYSRYLNVQVSKMTASYRISTFFFILRHMPGNWWDTYIVTPFVKRKLRKMIKKL